MKLTALGKEMRKIRLDRGEVLLDMSKRIGMSAAMLSSIETGHKPAPEDFVDRLAQQYEEVARQKDAFEHLADLTKKSVKLSLDQLDNAKNETAVVLARHWPSITPADLDKLRNVLNKYAEDPNGTKIEGKDL